MSLTNTPWTSLLGGTSPRITYLAKFAFDLIFLLTALGRYAYAPWRLACLHCSKKDNPQPLAVVGAAAVLGWLGLRFGWVQPNR